MRLTHLSLALSLTVLLLGIGQARANNHDELVVGLAQYPSTFHPSIGSMTARDFVMGMVRRPITTMDHDGRLICMLCTELPTFENGLAVREKTPDGSKGVAVTVTLQPDAIWADGKPITSSDLVFSWKVGRHPKAGFAVTDLYRSIYRIDIVNKKRVVLHLDRLYFDYNDIGSLEILPSHLEKNVFEKSPGNYQKNTLYHTDPTNPGLYFGPYKISEVKVGKRIVLVQNPTWYGTRPHFKKIIIKIIENTKDYVEVLRTGKVDMVSGEVGLDADQSTFIKRRIGEKFQILTIPSLGYEQVLLNLSNPILMDRRVRQALYQAVDLDAISEQLFEGKQSIAHKNVDTLISPPNVQTDPFPYDPEKASNLLEAAGWLRQSNGPRRNANGEILKLVFSTTSGNRTRKFLQLILQAMWARIGLDVEIRNFPPQELFGGILSQRKIGDLFLISRTFKPNESLRSILHSKAIPTLENNWSGQNYTGLKNSEIDKLIEALELETNGNRRTQLWRRLRASYHQEITSIPLFFRTKSHILPPWLTGYRPTGHNTPTTFWIEYWRIRQ